MQAMHQWGF